MEHLKKYWWLYLLLILAIIAAVQYKRDAWPFQNSKADGKPCTRNINSDLPPILNEHWPSADGISVMGVWRNGVCMVDVNNLI